MALNPSCNSVQGTGLPVLGDPPFENDRAQVAIQELRRFVPARSLSLVVEEVERQVWKKGSRGAEMAACGMHVVYPSADKDMEWVYLKRVVGCAYGWKFTRLWYYWSCTTESNPIPEAEALRLNETWSSQVRVEGYAGGTGVRGDVFEYHVDTPDGLAALVEAIRACPGSKG